MPNFTATLLASKNSNGLGAPVQVDATKKNRSFVVNLTGSGSLAATVVALVSNDNGATWAPRMTFTLAGTNLVQDADVDENSPFDLVVGQVSGLTGIGGVVTLSMCAS